jgi:hypothetical protein
MLPVACAVLNGLAALALATVLAPGVSLAPTPAHAAYVAEHLVPWRLGWCLWIAAAVSLLAFFRWWATRIGWTAVARAAIVVAVAGVLADIGAEARLIAWSPGQPFDLAGALQMSGVVANGSYSISGMLLTSRTRGLPPWLAAWSWAVWLVGIGLAAAAALSIDGASRALTAALFVLFLPWLVVFGRRLA